MQRIFGLLLLLGAYAPLLAQEAAVEKKPMIGSTMVMMVLMFAVIYFLMIRPEQKKQKDRQNLIKEIKKGDHVLMTSGMYGTVGNVKETTVMVKVAENTVLEFAKSAVATVLNEDGSERKPVKAATEKKEDTSAKT